MSETINALVGVKLLKEKIIRVGFDSFRYDYKLTDQGEQLFDEVQQICGQLVTPISAEIREFEKLSTPNLVLLAKQISGIESLH